MHFGNLFQRRQNRAEKGRNVLFGDGERARSAEGFEQGVQSGGKGRRRMVYRIVCEQKTRILVQSVKIVCQEHEPTAAAALHEIQRDGGCALLYMDSALDLHADRGDEGRILHEREKARERARRELQGFAVEEPSCACAEGAEMLAVDETAFFVLPDIQKKSPEFCRDARSKDRRLRINRQLLAKFDAASREERAQQLLHAAHDVEPLTSDAKLQPARRASVMPLEEEARLQKERCFPKSRRRQILLLLQMRTPLGARKTFEEPSCGHVAAQIAADFALLRLNLLQERDDMFTGARVECGGRTGTVVSLNGFPRLIETRTHLIFFRADDGSDIDGSVGTAQQLCDTSVLEVAAALAVRHVVGQRVYGGVLEQDDLSFARSTRLC